MCYRGLYQRVLCFHELKAVWLKKWDFFVNCWNWFSYHCYIAWEWTNAFKWNIFVARTTYLLYFITVTPKIFCNRCIIGFNIIIPSISGLCVFWRFSIHQCRQSWEWRIALATYKMLIWLECQYTCKIVHKYKSHAMGCLLHTI